MYLIWVYFLKQNYQKEGQKMNKLLEKIKNLFGCKGGKKEEPKPQQEQPKPGEKPKEQK